MSLQNNQLGNWFDSSKDRALKFSNNWADESRERAEKDSFQNEFFQVFGKSRKTIAIFEKAVKKLGSSQGYIDVF